MSPVRIDQEMYKPNMIPETVTPKNIPDVVPACPTGLAFQKQDFLHSDFTVDGFLSCSMASGNDVGLERLRDDLGLYLKVSNLKHVKISHKFISIIPPKLRLESF